ncbi:hypothetical protein ABZ369_22360 [Streptomyces sp. NPDC005918]|uniref:hypothetical protein n=1 Tax=Streptomyces sp. NPDC005918 TaxID=3155454 RepID=UPI0033CF8C56
MAALARELAHKQEAEARWQQHADAFARHADDASRDRAMLLAWVTALHPATAVIAPAAEPYGGGSHVVVLTAGGWHTGWPVAPLYLPLFPHVERVEPSDPRAQWDSPTTAQTYARIQEHIRLLVLEDEPSQGARGA